MTDISTRPSVYAHMLGLMTCARRDIAVKIRVDDAAQVVELSWGDRDHKVYRTHSWGWGAFMKATPIELLNQAGVPVRDDF